MQINDTIRGFRILNIRHLDEINADMYEMVHEKTSARTIWLKRDDENKTFSIAFKTTPVDDTGVFHILEHSVLNGSEKYPVKEPFVDLLKGSLQTFLNAMTYPDKTVYPVSSRNDKDFINLMRVYLDAVFKPLAVKSPYTFYQEGWHYELDSLNGQPSYKGVVFNEMKGAFSSADSIKARLMMHQLFPDNCYGYESGGDPEAITDLSYEQFCASHKKYYSPANSYIFLDGDMDIDKILGIIDEEYLKDYDASGEKIDIPKQKPVTSRIVTDYEIGENEDPEGKAHISYGYVFADHDDQEKIAAFSLISSLLCASNESPLKKVILDRQLAEDISFDVQDGILQPYLVIDVMNTDLNKEEQIKDAIFGELKRLVKEGLDKEELEANLNQREFKAKERDFGGAPKGLVFALSSLDTWLYGSDPAKGICFNDLFDSLREKIGTSYYEDLIRECILESDHKAEVLLRPDNTMGKKKAQKEKEKLAKAAASWTDQDRKQLLAMNEALHLKQSSEDTPEQKATLPALHLEDLKKEPTRYDIDVREYEGTRILKHDQDTNGISYTTLYSAINDLELEEHTVLTQLLSFLGKLKTAKYDILTLNRKMRSVIGDFAASHSPMADYASGRQNNCLVIGWSSLCRNDAEAIELIEQIIYHTDFSDKKIIRDILKQNIFALQQTFTGAGHSLAVQRASAYSSATAVVSEYAGGYEAYRYLKDLDENWDQKADSFISKLQDIYRKIFIKERYTLSIASENAAADIETLLHDAPSGTIGTEIIKKPLGHRREGIVIPANISYAVKSSNLFNEVKDPGTMYVLANILTYDYLWNNVRVKNGAYGTGFRCGYARQASFYSYRDPDPSNALGIYAATKDYLKDFAARVKDIENYIVGTTGDYDPLLSTKSAIRVSDLEYLMGITYELKAKTLSSILSTTVEDIAGTIPLFEKIEADDNVCVIGNKQALDKCRNRLDDIFDLG